MEHDYKAVLDRFNHSIIKNAEGDTFETLYGIPIKAIQSALRLADRLQSLEHNQISQMVYDAGENARNNHLKCFHQDDDDVNFMAIFKAMAAQMIKEIEGEL